MNKTHRVVWSKSRGAFIVAHEFAASGGSGSATRTVIAQSLAAALFTVVAAPVFGGTVLVNTAGAGQQTLSASETLIVTNTGVITATGGAAGVSAATISGGVNNSGTIQGNGAGSGIDVNGGTLGGINNSASTSFINGSVGISLENNASITSVVNAGTVSASGSGSTIHLTQSTVGTLTNSGTASSIGGANTGIRLDTGATITVLNNSGTITGVSAEGIVVDGGTIGTLNNTGASAVIHGRSTGLGLIGATVGSIVNSGTMSGGLAGFYLNASTISNLSNSGLISGNNTQNQDAIGINVSSGAITSITNTGTIFGRNAGVQLVSGSIGAVVNAGTISGESTGVLVGGGIMSSISNSGLIKGESVGIAVGNGGTITSVVNSGTISGDTYGIGVGAGLISSISNSGTISASTGIGVHGGTISSIANSGTISGSSVGLAVNNFGTITSIVNSGTISGNRSGINVNHGVVGTIQNLGLISGKGSAGVFIGPGGVLGSLVNLGTISGAGAAVDFEEGTLTGGITNSGLLIGTFSDGVFFHDTGAVAGGVTNLKGGVISGASGVGLYAATADFITNEKGATISGFGDGTTGFAGIGVRSVSTLTGQISNAGVITGIGFGISAASGSTIGGGIVNSGLINGGTAGIYFNGSYDGVQVAGGITNLKGGTISGGATGISLLNGSTLTGGLTNSGVISGATYSVYVDSTSSLGPITIGGVNSAQFAGDVYALASDVTVSSGSVFSATNAFDVNSFTVGAGATVNLSNPASTASDPNGITVANGFINAGTVSVARGVTGAINGAYTQTSSGTYKLGASSVSSYGVLAVNGSVALPSDAKIYVDVAANNTLTNKQVLSGVITSTSLTASTFDVTDNLALLSFTGVVDGNNVDLVTKVNALVLQDVLANSNYNAAPAARVIDEIIATDSNGPLAPVIDEFAKLQTTQQVSKAASELLPLLSGASNVASIGTLWELDQVIQSRLEGNPGLSSGDDYLTDRGAWVKPFGSWGNQSDQGSAPGFTSNTGGIVLGADGAVSHETRLGLAFAYASSDITGKGAEAPDENKVDLYQVVGYGSYALDPVTELNFQVDGGGTSNSGHRSLPTFGATARSSYNASTAHVGVGLGRAMPIDDLTSWTPSVRVDYTWVRSDSYSETGAGALNLDVRSASAEQLLTSVDAKIVHKVNDYASIFGNVGVGYDSLARNNTQVISAFAGAPGLPFATEGVGLKPWTVLAGFGVVATPQGGPEITVRYDLQDRSSFTEQSFFVKARWAF